MISALADVAEMFVGGMGGRLDEPTRQLLAGMAAQSSPADVVEALTERLTESAGQATTFRLARAVRQFAGDISGTVLDPACGIGSLLLAFAARKNIALAGQEIDPSSVRLAQGRVALGNTANKTISVGDSLRADQWPDLRADLVVCDPPVNVADWGREDLLLDARWEFGVATRAESELAWLQHCYAHVVPGGKVVFVMPPSVAYRKAGRRIRAEIVRRGLLTHVVALPPAMMASHTQSVHLWILGRPSESAAPASFVRMIDLTTANPTGPFHPAPDQVVDVPIIDLLDEVVDLTPTFHVAATRTDHVAEYTATRDVLLEQLRVVATLLPSLSPGQGALDGAMMRLADLARAGLVDIADGAVTSISDQLDTDYLRGFMRSGANTARGTSASGTFRADVRGSRVPRMTIDEQRRYAAAFRALDDAETRVQELTRLGREVIASARDGLTSGNLRPGAPR